MNARLTLAVPYFRNARYLGRAVASVLAQRDGRWRLVVSDGGGDPAGEARNVLAGFDDPRIGYLAPVGRLGMAANWNRCLDAAGAGLVTLLHDDDELLPDYVGRMRTAAAADPEAVAFFCEAAVIGPDGRPRFSMPDFVKRFLRPRPGRVVALRGQAGVAALLRGNFVMCPTLCFRLGRLGPRRFAADWGQVPDLDLTCRLLADGERLVGLPDVLYAYRRHAENATAAQTRTLVRFREEIALYDRLADEARRRGWGRAAGVARRKSMIRLNLGFCLLQDLARGRWADAARKGGLLAQGW